MIIVIEAFDDNSATLFDTFNFAKNTLTEQQLIWYGNNNEVTGLSVNERSINYIHAYDLIQFESEYEVNEYIRANGCSYKNKQYASGIWWYFKKKDTKIHVDYYVVTYKGDEITYVGEKVPYTPYKQAAKVYSKTKAGETAALMTQNSKTGTHWTTLRESVYFR